MEVADAVGKTAKLADLSVDVSGLYLLSRDSTPAVVIEAVAERSAEGGRLTLKEVERLIAEAREADRGRI